MHIGIDSFVSTVTDPDTGVDVSPVQRVQHLLEEAERADQVGLDSFGIGEHHRQEFMDSAPAVLLAAAAARTTTIRLNSAVRVLSASDPVRVFQEFATLDLVSQGRIDLVVGRGSFTEAFPLFGLDLADYDSLFSENLDLLLRIRDNPEVTWSGPPPPTAEPPGCLPPPAAGPPPDLGGRRRRTGVVRPRRHPRATPDGRDHRRPAHPLPAAHRPLPRGRPPRRPRPAAARGRASLHRVRRRDPAGGCR